ncbi:MAG: peptidylprolyl isomerase [Bryobacteraceae bacterium]|nr:peptidylprolyl isomerase [Bryobacteraceae bacterium]
MTNRFWFSCIAACAFASVLAAQAPAPAKKKSAGTAKKGAAASAAMPDVWRARFDTTKGPFVVEVRKAWAPIGADRFYRLIRSGYYNDSGFFRIVPNFVVQFGLAADPAVTKKWDNAIKDDPVTQSNKMGTLTFATAGPNTRTTQMFINLRDNARLDTMGFAPIGEVVEGMDVIKGLNQEYGESPEQGEITSKGNAYLKAKFPRLDFITKAVVLPASGQAPAAAPAKPAAPAPKPAAAPTKPAAKKKTTPDTKK